ncbi:MAG: peptidase M16 [Candidatus Aminicenantes bacterium]|nr:peptidase M16 [Candidatus Aminicenantes bacterium]
MNKRNRIKLTLFFSLFTILFWKSPLLSQEKFRKSPPYPEPLAELKLPEIKPTYLSNGLGVAVIQREGLPVISLKVIIFTGESPSLRELPGIATLTAYMVSRGVSYLTASQIEEIIESVGGKFYTYTYPDYSEFSFTFLEEFLDQALNLMSKMILQPTFLRREIENIKRIMYYDLHEKNKDPEFVAERQLGRLVFQNHPYEKSTFNEDVIKALNQRALVSFYDRYYRPNNSLFVLTGNLNLQTATRKVSRYFSTWRRKELDYPSIPPLEPYDKPKICLIDLPEAKDAMIYLGNIVSLSDQDVFPFIVLNQVLGGTHTSRLFMNLRESKGYAYYAFSELDLFKKGSVFFVKAKVRPEVTYASILEILREIEKITREEIPSSEIEQAKSYLIGNFPLQIQTLDKLSSKISEINALDLGEKHWSKYYENIMLVSSERVFEIARKYRLLTPVVVIVGDKDIISNYIQEFEEVFVYNNKGILQYTIKKGENE